MISGFTYFLMGTARDVNLGPTSLISLMTAEIGEKVGYSIPIHHMLCLFTGIFMIIFAFLRLEIFIKIFPPTVTTGFTSAAAILIVCSQLKHIFGIEKLPRDFIELIPAFILKIGETKIWDLTAALLTLTFLLTIQYANPAINKVFSKNPQKSTANKICFTAWTVFSTLRAILAIVISAVVAYFLPQNILKLVGQVPGGLPSFDSPPFLGLTANISGANNTMTEEYYSFWDLMVEIKIGLVMMPLISTIELLAIGRSLSTRNGYAIDPSQELFACGAAHLFGSFLSAYPASASITRSALNSQCRVRTPFCSAITASLVLIAAVSIADRFLPFIPKASLAAVVVAAALSMIEIHMAKTIWKVNRVDIIPTAITFVACLINIEYGIITGIVAALVISAILSMRSTRLNVQFKEIMLGKSKGLILTIPSGELRYPCADTLKKRWRVTAHFIGPLAIDCSHVREVDFSTIQALIHLGRSLKSGDVSSSYPIFFIGFNPEILPIMENAVKVLKTKPPNYRPIHFVKDLTEIENFASEENALEDNNPENWL